MDIEFAKYNVGMVRGGVVVLKDHDAAWAQCFDAVSSRIRTGLAPYAMELHHIGSTSIPGIAAKPIIDILGVVDNMDAYDAQKSAVEKLGFVWKGEYDVPGRRYCTLYNDGETIGYVHFHTFHRDHPETAAHLWFRDYLRALPSKAREYEKLKVELAGKHANDRKNYTNGKEALVKSLVQEALAWKQTRLAS